jgi:myosin heavy subunit
LNMLTKICIVVLAVTSLVACVVFISLATVTPNWRFEYEREKEAYGRLESESRKHMEATSRLTAELGEARRELRQTSSELRAEKRALTVEIQHHKIKNTDLQNKITSINDQLTAVENTHKTQQATNEKLQKELTESWTRETKLQSEMIRVADLLKEEEAKSERLEKNLKVTQEVCQDLKSELAERNKRITELEQGGAVAAGKKDVQPLPTHKIAGTVTAVSDNLASINIGSAHGIKEGMKLVVYRGDQFVGHLKIEQVRVNEAAGIIVDKRLAPRQGDKVTSHLN